MKSTKQSGRYTRSEFYSDLQEAVESLRSKLSDARRSKQADRSSKIEDLRNSLRCVAMRMSLCANSPQVVTVKNGKVTVRDTKTSLMKLAKQVADGLYTIVAAIDRYNGHKPFAIECANKLWVPKVVWERTKKNA